MTPVQSLMRRLENRAIERGYNEKDHLLFIESSRTLNEQAQMIEELERDLEKEVRQRDHWEEKATELATEIGSALGFDVGEHSNMNCPVQTAIDGVHEMGAEIEEWRKL